MAVDLCIHSRPTAHIAGGSAVLAHHEEKPSQTHEGAEVRVCVAKGRMGGEGGTISTRGVSPKMQELSRKK